MAEFPSLPLFTDAYLGDTTHLSTFEHGAYLLMLIVSWRSPGCCLPDDNALLARYTRMTADKWRKVRPILAPFFQIRDGFWHQPRLQDEFQLLQSRRAQQSEAGKASVISKALKRKNRGSTSAGKPLKRTSNETSTPTPTYSDTNVSGATAPEIDPAKALFDRGVALLMRQGDRTDKAARSMIAKWRKARGHDWVDRALTAAEEHARGDVAGWIEQRLKRDVAATDARDAYNNHIAELARQAREAEALEEST